MLKHTEVELDLLDDSGKIPMIEKHICGGISERAKRYAKANNTYMKNYN